MNNLSNQRCKPCDEKTPRLSKVEIQALLKQLDKWILENQLITKTFEFKNYYQTMAFVNAVAWLSHREDHHPELKVGFSKCRVDYFTHAVGGLSENDFSCAAKVEALFKI